MINHGLPPTLRAVSKKRQLAWVRNDVEQYNIYRNKVAKLCKVARRRFYEDKICYTNDINPKKWWDNIKMLSGLSSQQSLTSMTVNGSILRDDKLAEAIGESFYRVSSDITPLNPFQLQAFPIHIRFSLKLSKFCYLV